MPEAGHGWLVALGLYLFLAFYALGPGVCVWLALSELMPTRIRSNGMSIALVINQLVSTTLAAIFLPFVSKYGYSSMFFLFAGFTVIYLMTVAFFLPETKGKTLEEIEAYFEGPQQCVLRSEARVDRRKMNVTLFPAVAQLVLLEQRKISPLELADEHIRQIERLNPALNAIIDFDAERVRARRARPVRGFARRTAAHYQIVDRHQRTSV